jgi:hypothetical protein
MISNKLDYVSSKLSTLYNIDKRLSDLERNVNFVNQELKEMKDMKSKVVEIEKSMNHISLQYDDQQKAAKEIEHTLRNIDKRSTSTFKENEVMRAELQTMRSDLNDLKERHLDLQSRSMRDNLIFDGIPETHEEDPEAIIKDFIRKEMEITDDMEFHRVHRMGKKIGNKHRPIIAKFVLHKDKERVRRAAPGTLRGKPYGVNEQFPKEINERRKQLYPEARKKSVIDCRQTLRGRTTYTLRPIADTTACAPRLQN